MSLKIRHKLFLAILVANILFAGSIYLLSSWTFGSSFRDYLDQSAAEKLSPLAVAIGEKYQLHNNWRWVKNKREQTWKNLLRKYAVSTPRPTRDNKTFNPDNEHRRPRPDVGDTDMKPPPDKQRREHIRPPLGVNPRLLLADENKRLIIGNPKRKKNAYWIPVKTNDATVGYLGFVRTGKLTSQLDQLFARKLQTSFIWISLGLLIITTMIALPVARQMVKPIIHLRRATSKLASGNYTTRITSHNNDEMGELSQDFNYLAGTLEKNLSSRQQWIADISHELRTPIAILQGEVEAMQDGIRNISAESMNSLHQEILSLSKLISELHELSLSDMGALNYKKETINIVEVISDVLNQHKDNLEKKSFTTNFLHSSANITINGDEQKLKQLFTNLIVNSMFYTDEGGYIDISIDENSHYVNIIWADSEPGLDARTLPLLFDRLYRAEGSRNRNTGGSGLGLAICRNIVEGHHGSIEAKKSARSGIAMHIQLLKN
jgi:two-component system sensor histidine kinase BaeS